MEKTGSSSSSQPSRKRGREAEASSSRGKSASKAGGGAGGNSSGGDGVASGSKRGASGSVSSSATTSQAIQISSDDFKTLNEKFGREWTTLTRLATSTSTYEDPDVPCAVCDDHLDDEENEIIFCDGGGCNVAVHQECYGVQVVPEGKWFCQKCKLSPRDPVTCVLCRRSIGAFKQTTNQGEWAHVLCASYIPGVSFGDYSKLEPVKGVDKCVKERQKMRCSICHEKGGAPIQCAEKKCCKPFHVSCARDKGLLESMAQEGPTLLPDFERGAMPRVWCEVHRPKGIVDNQAQKLLKIEQNKKCCINLARAKQTSNASTAARRLADLCSSTLQQLNQPLPSLHSQPSALHPPSDAFQRAGSESSVDSDSIGGDTPPPKRFKSTHSHPADQILDLESQLEESHTRAQETKEENKRLKAELAAMKKKTASETLDASKLKGRYQKAFQGLKAEVVKKDDELSRLRAKIAAGGGGGGAEAGPSTMASGSSGSTEEPKKEEKSVEHQIKSALRKRDKEYRKPMAALQHYQRTWKYWENEREKTDGFFKDKVAAETELAKIITENEAKDSARAKELTDLLTLYEHASQSLLLPIPDAEKLALVSQHLGEMAVLLATTRRAEEEEKRARRAAEEGGGEGGGEGSV